MKLLENLISSFKEILYDIIGYIVPGIFFMLILSMPLIIEKKYSFMYGLYEILFNPNISINKNILNHLENISFFKIYFIIFIAYLLGHLSISLSSLFKPIGKFFKKKFDWNNKYKDFSNNILNNLDKNPKFKTELFKSKSGEYNKDFIITFASTYSRFKSHNDLIQKYICKINLYASLSFIFFILSIDSFISSICWKLINNSITCNQSFDVYILFIISLLFISFLSLLNQYYKHKYLKEKECYLFLYEYFNS